MMNDIASKVPDTPCYVVDKGLLENNLKVLAGVREQAGCGVLLALKGFAMYGVFPLVKKYLSGVSASSLDEARLGREEFGGEVHVCAPAYKGGEFEELLSYSSHVIFNSFSQWERFRPVIREKKPGLKCGLRINPEHSEVKVELYDPCKKGSRLGIKRERFEGKDLEGITGLHFHTLCELGPDALERTLAAVEEKFGGLIEKMEWVNFGGGHHITRADYDVDRLIRLVRSFREKYGVDVFLEPGEAIALNAGYLVAEVLDIVHNDVEIAVLDTSAAAHMPDVLEMPYRPGIIGAGEPGELARTYRLGGMTCLAGDVIGDYSFPGPLKPGSRVVFTDMAHYTMVKNNTFNGVRLPDIAVYDPALGKVEVIKKFGYEDYRGRLS